MTPFEFEFGGPIWKVLGEDPATKQMYDDYMSARKYGLDQSWIDVFPAVELLLSSTKCDEGTPSRQPMVVDVGGGQGQDLVRLINARPGQFDDQRFVLEDLPETLAHVDSLPKCVETRAHDFFEEQPVKGKPGRTRSWSAHTPD